jgi:HEAT repeat protein
VAEGFRLIYLKSTDSEKASLEEPPSLRQGERNLIPPSPPLNEFRDVYSSRTILNQAKEDLNHPDPKVRVVAIQYVGRIDSSIAIPLLQQKLSDQDLEVRVQALRSLIQFRDPAIGPLLKKYVKDREPLIRITALRGMFLWNEKIDRNLLLQFLSDESSWVRRKVATLLGWTPVEGAFPILMQLSKDPDPEVRKAALSSLLNLYPEESETRFMGVLTDKDPNLRTWARRHLEKKSGKSRRKD